MKFRSTEFALVLSFLFAPFVQAAVPSHIPRASTRAFLSEGLFEGGKDIRASLDSIRVAQHEERGFERWVVDFSDALGKQKGLVAPKFQLQYLKAQSFTTESGDEVVQRPAKFLLLLRNISKNSLDQAEVRKAAKKSGLVQDVILYPPIEQGDMAIEFVLKKNVLFEAHQPIERQGRLVLDLKPSRLN